MNTLIFDIDGTICPIKSKNDSYEDLVPYSKMVKKINEYKKNGFKILLFTSRNMRTYEGDMDKIMKYTKPILEKWLKKWNIQYDEIVFGKPWPGEQGFYIDDRTVRPKEFIEYDISDLNKICNIDKSI